MIDPNCICCMIIMLDGAMISLKKRGAIVFVIAFIIIVVPSLIIYFLSGKFKCIAIAAAIFIYMTVITISMECRVVAGSSAAVAVVVGIIIGDCD